MRISTENLFTLSFVCVFLFVLSFAVAPQFAVWLGRVVLLMQAYFCLSAILDRFRF